MGRLICGSPDVGGGLLSKTRHSFKPSCWLTMKHQCKAQCRLQLFTCVAMIPALTSVQSLASKACSSEPAEAAVTPPSCRVRCNVPDTNSFSKVRHRLGLGLHPVYLAVNVLPGLGNPKAASRLLKPGRSHWSLCTCCSEALFSRCLLLDAAGEDMLD